MTAACRRAGALHFQYHGTTGRGMQAIANHEPTVVVQEADHVQSPVLALEHERKQVGLLQLIGAGAFEAPHLVGMRTCHLFLELITGKVQCPGDRTRACRQCGAAHQFIGDPLAAPLGVRLFEHHDRALGQLQQLAAGLRALRWPGQPGRPLFAEALPPQI